VDSAVGSSTSVTASTVFFAFLTLAGTSTVSLTSASLSAATSSSSSVNS